MKRHPLLPVVFFLTSCLFSPPSKEKPLDIFGQDPFVRALLDANGLKDVPLSEVTKVLEPDDPHRQDWYIDLRGRGIKSFNFTSDVKKLSLYIVVDLQDNEMTRPPSGLNLKSWRYIFMEGNKLCNLTAGDSATLVGNNITFSKQKCP